MLHFLLFLFIILPSILFSLNYNFLYLSFFVLVVVNSVQEQKNVSRTLLVKITLWTLNFFILSTMWVSRFVGLNKNIIIFTYHRILVATCDSDSAIELSHINASVKFIQNLFIFLFSFLINWILFFSLFSVWLVVKVNNSAGQFLLYLFIFCFDW